MSSEVLIVKSLNSASPNPVILQPETPAEYPEDLNIEAAPSNIISAEEIVPALSFDAVNSLTSIESMRAAVEADSWVHSPLLFELSTVLTLP